MTTFTPEQLANLCLAFVNAFYRQANDEAIVQVYQDICAVDAQSFFTFTEEEQKRIAHAQKCVPARRAMRQALADGYVSDIVTVFNQNELQDDTGLTQDERKPIELAQEFVQAYQSQTDEDIVIAFDKIKFSPYGTQLRFTAEESQRIADAQRLNSVRQRMKEALTYGITAQIMKIYEENEAILAGDSSITPGQREQIKLAQLFQQALASNNDAAIIQSYNLILASPHCKDFTFSPVEKARIDRARFPLPVSPSNPYVTINGQLISKEYLYQVRAVRLQYLRLRREQIRGRIPLPGPTQQWVNMNTRNLDLQQGEAEKKRQQDISNKTFDDMKFDLAFLKQEVLVSGLSSQVKDVVESLYRDMVAMRDFDFAAFLAANRLDDIMVQNILAIYARREAVALYRFTNHLEPLESYLRRKEPDVQVQFPGQPVPTLQDIQQSNPDQHYSLAGFWNWLKG